MIPARSDAWVPIWLPTSPLLQIKKGSGIVGRVTEQPGRSYVSLDYEGNLYGAVNLTRYVERVAHAYDRQVTGYPTVARMHAPAEWVEQIGWYSPDGYIVVEPTLESWAKLRKWLGVDDVPKAELEVIA